MSKSDQALNTLVKMLEKKRELKAEYDAAIKKIDEEQSKVSEHLIETCEFEEVPDIICEDDPYTAWNIGKQNDAFAIRLYRIIRDKVTANNRQAKDFEAFYNEYKTRIGGWLLDALNKSGAKSINCGEVGTAYRQQKVTASPADWDSFLVWAAENEAGDAIQKRVNSSFVKKYEEETGETPPFLNVFKEYEIVVRK